MFFIEKSNIIEKIGFLNAQKFGQINAGYEKLTFLLLKNQVEILPQ